MAQFDGLKIQKVKLSPIQPVCSVFTEDIKPGNIAGELSEMGCRYQHTPLTHPAQGMEKSMSNTGLSDLKEKKKEKSVFIKTEKNPSLFQLHSSICLLLSYRNSATCSLHVLMKLENDMNLQQGEVARLIYSHQEELYALGSIMINSEIQVVTTEGEQLDPGNDSVSWVQQ